MVSDKVEQQEGEGEEGRLNWQDHSDTAVSNFSERINQVLCCPLLQISPCFVTLNPSGVFMLFL